LSLHETEPVMLANLIIFE
jgi:hypothetical protein